MTGRIWIYKCVCASATERSALSYYNIIYNYTYYMIFSREFFSPDSPAERAHAVVFLQRRYVIGIINYYYNIRTMCTARLSLVRASRKSAAIGPYDWTRAFSPHYVYNILTWRQKNILLCSHHIVATNYIRCIDIHNARRLYFTRCNVYMRFDFHVVPSEEGGKNILYIIIITNRHGCRVVATLK